MYKRQTPTIRDATQQDAAAIARLAEDAGMGTLTPRGTSYVALDGDRIVGFIRIVEAEGDQMCIRDRLTAIRGNAEMLEDPDLPPELHEKFCSIIIAESERLSRLTHDLLTLQRIDDNAMPMELSRVNLRELATGAVSYTHLRSRRSGFSDANAGVSHETPASCLPVAG